MTSINNDINKLSEISVSVSPAFPSKYPPIPTYQKPVSPTILSHVAADYYISGAPGLEGNNQADSLHFMIHSLRKLPSRLQTPEIQKIISEFEICSHMAQRDTEYRELEYDLSKKEEIPLEEKERRLKSFSLKIIEEMQEIIRNLGPGKSALFPGGWVARPPGVGHAIMHRIERQENGKLSLCTFNTGDGIQFFHEYSVDDRGYRRYKPVVTRVDIEETELLKTNRLLSLVDLRIQPLEDKDAAHGAEIIYDAILPAFGGRDVSASSRVIHAMRAQRSGTCSWKVLNAILNQSLEAKLYKSIKIALRLQTIRTFLEQNKMINASLFFHIENDLEKIVRALKKGKHGFDFDETRASLAEIDQLRCAAKTAFQEEKKMIPEMRPIHHGKTFQFALSESPAPLIEQQSIEEVPATQFIPPAIACPDSKEINAHLSEWLRLCRALYKFKQFHDVIFTVNRVIQTLPVPQVSNDPFWGGFNEKTDEEIREAISLIAELNELMFRSCFHVRASHASEKATALMSYCIQVKLLENLFQYVRISSRHALLGLQSQYIYEINVCHIEALRSANVFAHDPKLEEKLKACLAFIKVGGSFDNILESLRTNGRTHASFSENLTDEGREKFHRICNEIKSKIQTFNPEQAKSVLQLDFGQFGYLPAFLPPIHKQLIFTSLLLAFQNFASRRAGSKASDAFTLNVWSLDAILKDPQKAPYSGVCVKGAGRMGRISASDLLESYLERIHNPDMRKLIHSIIDYRSYDYSNPNVVLTNYSQFKSLSSEEASALLALANTPADLTVWQVISFFSQNIDLLHRRDYQLFFEWALLPVLEEELHKHPESSKPILTFILNGLDEFKAPSQIDEFLFLIRLGLHVEKRLKIVPASFPDWLAILSQKREQSQDPNEKKAIDALNAHVLVSQSDAFNPDILPKILYGLSLLQSGEVPDSMMDAEMKRSIIQWLHHHAASIENFIDASPSNKISLCNAVLSGSSHEPPIDFWKEINLPVFESQQGDLRVNLLTGELWIKNASQASIPLSIREHPSFTRLFGSKKRIASVACFHCFTFIENGKTFRGRIQSSGELVIEQQVKEKWFRYLPLEELPSESLPPGMREVYTHWISYEENGRRSLLIQNDSFQECYVAKEWVFNEEYKAKGWKCDPYTGQLVQGFSIQNNKNETLVDSQVFEEATSRLALFEKPDFIQGWMDSENTVRVIDIPRYGLQFEYEGGAYQSRQFPGLCIAAKQDFSLFPWITSYLILENGKGERKALLPSQSFSKNLSREHPLIGELSSEPDSSFGIVAIDLDRTQKPAVLNQEQALYLAYLALVNRRYAEAANYVAISEKLSGGNIAQVVSKMTHVFSSDDGKDADAHPKAKAIALRAGMLLLKEERCRFKSSDTTGERKIRNLLSELYKIYQKYHEADANSGYMALTETDERRLLQEFFNAQLLDRQLFDRFLHLQKREKLPTQERSADGLKNPEGKTFLEWEAFQWMGATSQVSKWVNALGEGIWESGNSLSNRPLTRPGKYFIPYFIQVCLNLEEVRKQAHKKAELSEYLKFMKWTESQILTRHCLEDILAHEDFYHDALVGLRSCASERKTLEAGFWISELFKKFKERAQKREPEKKKTHLLSAPLTMPCVSHPLPLNKEKVIQEPLLSAEKLQDYFNITDLPKEDLLPDIDLSSALKRHERHHIEQFNASKKKFYQNVQSAKRVQVKDISNLEKELLSGLEKEEAYLQRKKEKLLNLANALPLDEKKSLEMKLAKAGQEKRELNLDDLILLYLKGSEKDILAACPGLNPDLSSQLIKGVSQYLVHATEQQQRKRALARIYEIQKLLDQRKNSETQKAIENASSELYNAMSAKREYEIAEHPEYLVFEYHADILLRKEQVNVLILLQQAKDPKETELVVQLIMGAGKTKVLLPILALKNADGEKLSMVIVAPSLYETNRCDLKLTSIGKLYQEPATFEFDRNTPFTEEELRNKLWGLQNAICDRNYVITTPESIQSAKLKYKEILKRIDSGSLTISEAEPKLKILSDILHLFKTRGWAVFDEIDTLLDVRREVNFPIGAIKGMQKDEIQLIEDIYSLLLGSDEVKHLRGNKPEAFSIKDYFENVAPKIASALIKKWDLHGIQPEELPSYLVGKLKGQELAGLKEHLKRHVIALSKEMIVSLIPMALSKKGNEYFGLSKITNTKYPIPYKANDDPVETSEFGNIYETLLYAVHIYAQNGLKEVHIDELLQNVCRKIRLESKEKSTRFKDTQVSQEFTHIFGINDPFAITLADRRKISNAVKTSHAALFYWLKHFVYPEITTSTQKINANAYTLVDMLAHVQGFTGTPWNLPVYHERLQKPEKLDACTSPESELAILHAIYQKVKEGGIHKISENTPRDVLNRIVQEFQFDCLIDVGALLNGISNADVAKAIKAQAEKEGLRGVIYFNDANELVAEVQGIPKPILLNQISSDELKSYYDQKHTTGTDIKQRSTAKALMTFSNKTTRDMTQGAMRMRQLLSSQQIEIVIPAEIRDQIAKGSQNPTFEELLSFAITQQANRLSSDLVRSVKMKLQHILRQEIDEIIERSDVETQVKILKHFEEIMTDLFSNDPYAEFGSCFSLEDTFQVLESYRDEQIDLISRLISKEALRAFDKPAAEALLQKKELLVQRLKSFKMPEASLLDEKIPRENKAQMKKETLVEVEKEVEMEVEMQVEKPKYDPLLYSLWGQFGKYVPTTRADFFEPDQEKPSEDSLISLSINALLLREKPLQPFTGIFDKDLCTTKLFVDSAKEQREKLFGKDSQKIAYQMLFVVEEDGKMRTLLFDPKEAAAIRAKMDAGAFAKRKMVLLDLNSDFQQSYGSDLNEKESERLDQFKIQAKFFNGELIYTKQERKLLRAWLNDHDPRIVKELFEKIGYCHVGLAKKYAKSSMKKFLAKRIALRL
jgi:hypothetical protein